MVLLDLESQWGAHNYHPLNSLVPSFLFHRSNKAESKKSRSLSKIFKCIQESRLGDTMIALLFGVGILLVLLGIGALFIPSLARIINIPGNEKIKAIGVLIVGIIIMAYGYLSG